MKILKLLGSLVFLFVFFGLFLGLFYFVSQLNIIMLGLSLLILLAILGFLLQGYGYKNEEKGKTK